MASLPKIEIDFKQLATTLIQRSERGTAILLLKDAKATKISTNVYKSVADIDDSLYSDENLKYIKSCMAYAPYETVVISSNDSSISGFVPEILKARSTGWIAAAIADDAEPVVKVYDPGKSKNELGVKYTGTGIWSNDDGVSIKHNDVTYTQALKIQNNGSISFETPKAGKVTFIAYVESTSSVDTTFFTVDGKSVGFTNSTEVKVTKNSVLTTVGYSSIIDMELEAGEHTILRSNKNVYLFGMVFEYNESQIQADLASWVKSMENDGKTYKVVGTVKGNDCMHYVYFDQNCYDNDGNKMSACGYLASLLGIVASCNINRGCTNFLCTDLSRVDEVEDAESAVAAGQLVLQNDVGGVRIAAGINSLVTLNRDDATEDMQYIETVEAMDLIRDDIKTVFKTTYQGTYKNKYKNQLLFIGSVNQYYASLAAEDILDEEFDNVAEIDVEAQRSAWIGVGNTDAEDWDDDTVKKMSFKRSVFVANNIKILNCMEHLKFGVTLE